MSHGSVVNKAEGDLPRDSLYCELALDTAEQFVEELLPTAGSALRRHPNYIQWFYRGQADANWTLLPAVYRMVKHRHAGKDVEIAEIMRWAPGQVECPLPDPHDLARREMSLVMEFLDYLEAQGIAIPFDSPDFRSAAGSALRRSVDVHQFPPVQVRAMFALAQHYGLPTRLLDWTRKPLVAAYFAALEVARSTWEEGPREGRLSVWALNAMAPRWFGDRDPSFELITAPTASNPNLHAQGGIFSLVRFGIDNPSALEEHPPTLCNLIRSTDLQDLSYVDRPILPALVKVTLPFREARSLLHLLSHYGVNASQIYPGHRGAAQALLDQRWMQNAPPGYRS